MIETLNLHIEAEGDVPLLMHNGLLADREYEWTRKLASYTAKRVKTDEDHDEISRLEWLGGFYWDDNVGPYLPGENIRRSLHEAAKLSRQGKKIERGLLAISRVNRLEYDGPRDREAMWADVRFRHRATVRLSASRTIVRTRPRFQFWSAEVEMQFDTSQVDRSDLLGFAEMAGKFIGIGDGRSMLMGRFVTKELG